jgi:uncharacterized phage infection (PIP) family protein YhgE
MNAKLLSACVALAVAPLALAACGSSGMGSTSGTSTSNDAVCAARSQLEQSVKDLADPDVLTGGTKAIDGAVNHVQDELDALEAAARTDYRPQVDAVQRSFDQLKTAVGHLGDGKLSDNLSQIGDAISNLSDSTSTLYDTLQTRCG